MKKWLRWFFLLTVISSLSGCFYWVRAYQTYRQMDEFDRNFAIVASDKFNVQFKTPVLYSDDFVSLSKLQASESHRLSSGKQWRYWFHKIDEQGYPVQPEVKFYFDLLFNKDDRLTQWSFSSLFLQIAPADFLELSIRSLAGAKINKDKRQIKANTALMAKTATPLPQKTDVIRQLGEPIAIEDKEHKKIYTYHFLLQTEQIKEGYEDRALSVVKLTFDKSRHELIKMSGRFAGLKISIDYRNYIEKYPGLHT